MRLPTNITEAEMESIERACALLNQDPDIQKMFDLLEAGMWCGFTTSNSYNEADVRSIYYMTKAIRQFKGNLDTYAGNYRRKNEQEQSGEGWEGSVRKL